ncbi:MAG: hypothetical protein CME06_00800 [Gemmatimonadetes bacterium]|nr:hypothetical protein [Gemmatimonadota bacterium]
MMRWACAREAGALLDEGAWAEAIPILEALIERASDYSTARKFLGMAYVEAGRYDEARSLLERSVELAPDDEGAARELCELYVKLGEQEGARSIATHLGRLRPLDDDFADLLDQLQAEAPTIPEIGTELAEDAGRWIAAGARAVEQILGPGPDVQALTKVPRLRANVDDPPAQGTSEAPPPARADPAPAAPPGTAASPPAAPPRSLDAELATAPIETLTMADIYVEQGLYGQAMRIYQKQAELRPRDDSIAERIRRLEERIQKEGTDSNSLSSSPNSGA